MKFSRRFSYQVLLLLFLISLCLNALFAYQHRSSIKDVGRQALVASGLRKNSPQPKRVVTTESNAPLAYYAFLNSLEPVASSPTQEGASVLPESLVISPGKYLFHGNAYDFQKEGLYRLIVPGVENQQRIVYAGNLDALLSGIAWAHSHGNSDDTKSYAEISNIALQSKVLATCGSVSKWAQSVLKSKGVNSRMVTTLTLDPWNTWDNGHTLIEVYRDNYNKWVTYDLDNNTYFVKDGIPLSLQEFAQQSSSGAYEIKYLASDSNVDVSGFTTKDTGFNYIFLVEGSMSNEVSLRRWYKRVIQVPMVEDGDFYYFTSADNRQKIESYSNRYKYMEERQFMQKFYGAKAGSQANALF